MSGGQIDTVMHEDRRISSSSRICLSRRRSVRSRPTKSFTSGPRPIPQKFWGDLAKQELHWFQPFTKVLEWNEPFAKWFVGGRTATASSASPASSAVSRTAARRASSAGSAPLADRERRPCRPGTPRSRARLSRAALEQQHFEPGTSRSTATVPEGWGVFTSRIVTTGYFREPVPEGEMPEFLYQPLLEHGHDDTSYRRSRSRRSACASCSTAIAACSRSSPRRCASSPRSRSTTSRTCCAPSHLAAAPRASSTTRRRRANDRFVALELLKNANIAAGRDAAGLPGHRHRDRDRQQGPERAHGRRRRAKRSRAASSTPTRSATCATRRWRRSTCTPRRTPGTNLPAQIEIYAEPGDEYELPVHRQGRRLREQDVPVPGDQGAAQPDSLLELRRREDPHARHLGLPALPPGARRSAAPPPS